MKKKLIKILIFLFILILIIICNKETIINILNNIYSSFNRTIIEEKRYILLFNGLQATLIISFFSIIFGTLLGSILFLLQKIKIEIFDILSRIFVRFLQGVPVTVL